MQYLHQLKSDLIASFTDLTPDKVTLFLVNGEVASDSTDFTYIARLLLIDCREESPFLIIEWVRRWFKNKGHAVPDINFNSEIINLETYDLELDISLSDKMIFQMDADGNLTGDSTVCLEPVWSDELGTYIKGNIANG